MDRQAGTGRIDAAGDEDVRVQYRLDVQEGPTGFGDGADTRVGIVVDVQITGGDAVQGSMVNLAMRGFRFDRAGVITHVDRAYRWREDREVPIPSRISTFTGLDDADVPSLGIDEEVAVGLLRSACVVIAHGASFHRPWIERRLKGAGGLAWACSMMQVDWKSHGFDGLELGYLLRQAGWFHERRDVDVDVDAVIQLLRHRLADRTGLALLIKAAMRPGWIFRATGASFYVKDMLKHRSYRWDPDRRVWWREVSDDARISEESWLATNVYAVSAGPMSLGPEIEKITAATRFL